MAFPFFTIYLCSLILFLFHYAKLDSSFGFAFFNTPYTIPYQYILLFLFLLHLLLLPPIIYSNQRVISQHTQTAKPPSPLTSFPPSPSVPDTLHQRHPVFSRKESTALRGVPIFFLLKHVIYPWKTPSLHRLLEDATFYKRTHSSMSAARRAFKTRRQRSSRPAGAIGRPENIAITTGPPWSVPAHNRYRIPNAILIYHVVLTLSRSASRSVLQSPCLHGRTECLP